MCCCVPPGHSRVTANWLVLAASAPTSVSNSSSTFSNVLRTLSQQNYSLLTSLLPSKYPLLHVLLIFVKPASSLLDDSALCTWLYTRAFPTKMNPIRSKNIQMGGKAQSPLMKIVSVCTGMVLFPRKQASCLNFLTTSSDVPAYACVYL